MVWGKRGDNDEQETLQCLKRELYVLWSTYCLSVKGVFLGPNVHAKGMFSKLENNDMSCFLVPSEAPGWDIFQGRRKV